MKLAPDDLPALEAYLRPETPLERQLLKVPAFRQGLFWGEPRFGHPEGKVVYHLREVLNNVDLIDGLPVELRRQLRLISFAHDTFKYAEDRTRPRDWNKHHGILARQFMLDYTDDRAVLDILETHDDAYYAWLGYKHPYFIRDNPQKSVEVLLDRVSYCLQLYYLFFKCDTQTGDKTQAPIKWFEQTIMGIDVVRVREKIH
ncbi:MAG: hypothetical protein EP344_02530 [Bacteroidetes bacterium]|nr:MAG: hypothetical protein EP344_02530 [Bacteroidota bacterium]